MQHNVNREKELFYCFFAPICCFIDVILDDFETSKDIAASIFQEHWKEIINFDESGDAKELVKFLQQKSLTAAFQYLIERDQIQKAESEFARTDQTGFPSTDAILIEKDFLQFIHNNCKALPERQKKAIDLFFSGYGTEEGALIMNIKKSTFRNAKNKALRKLRKELIKEGFLILILLLLKSL